jgi:hypothetical protein
MSEGFPPGPPQPYGGFPPAPPPYAGPNARPERPREVRRAAFAWWAAVACWFLGSLSSQVLGGNVLRFTTFRSVRTGDGTVVTSATEGPLPAGIAVVTFLVLGALWALLVYGMYRGARWARILLAILGVLGILNVVLQLIAVAGADGMNGGDLAHLLFFLGTLVLSITGFVLMFKDGAVPYFAKRR